MMFANIREQTGDVPPDVYVWSLDARNDLYQGGEEVVKR